MEGKRPKRRGERAERPSTTARRLRAVELARAGHRTGMIATLLGLDGSTVSQYLAHPDSRARLQGAAPPRVVASARSDVDAALQALGAGTAA